MDLGRRTSRRFHTVKTEMDSLGHRVLLHGCGGGFDIFNGFFLMRELKRRGHEIHLANYTFTDDLHRYNPTDSMIVRITGHELRTKKNAAYFPEADLARQTGQPVYAVRLHGPARVLPELQALCDRLAIDSIVLVDGGHDAIIFGDEREWGSPLEDTCSIIIASQLRVPHSKFVVCISAPTENMDWPLFETRAATLCSQWTPANDEDTKDFEALLDVTAPETRSIPNECILACLRGHRAAHYENPRLKERLGDNPIEDWPPVIAETACHYMVSLDTLIEKSAFYTWILQQSCATLKDINRQIHVYKTTATRLPINSPSQK